MNTDEYEALAGCPTPVLRTPLVDLDCKLVHHPAKDGAFEVWTVWVKWKYHRELDKEFQFRKWDFLALHRPDKAVSEYESSLYLLGMPEGIVGLVAPPDGGDFCVSVVRDQKMVYRVMKDRQAQQAYARRIQPATGPNSQDRNWAEYLADRKTEDVVIISGPSNGKAITSVPYGMPGLHGYYEARSKSHSPPGAHYGTIESCERRTCLTRRCMCSRPEASG